MRTCACGGMLMDDWTTCRFCGRPAGEAGDPAPSPPPPPSFAQAGPGAGGGAAPTPGRSGIPPWVIVAGVVVVLGLLASFLFGGDDGGGGGTDGLAAGQTTTSAPPTTVSPEDQLIISISDFCDGDRAAVPAAVPYDGAPGRIHPISGLGSHDVSRPQGWTPNLEDLGQVELILCQDMVPGSESDGNRCDGYSTGVIVQNVNAQWHMRLYAVQSGEVLAETTVTTEGDGCPMNVVYDSDSIAGGMVREVRAPDWNTVEALVAPFVTP